MRREAFDIGLGAPFLAQQRLGLLQRAPPHKGFALGEAVGEQQRMMMRVGGDGFGGDEEIDRRHVGPLVQQLEKRVLSIGAGLAENHRAGGGFDRRAGARHGFAVRLHVELLQIGGKAREPLVIGDDGMGGASQHIAMPHAQEAHQRGDVFIERRLAKMRVDVEAATQKLHEMIGPDADRQSQSDRRPQRIAAADPIPKAEHALGVDAELRRFVQPRGHGGEVLWHRRLAERGDDARPRAGGVGHGLLRRESFRRDDEQRARKIERLQRVGKIGAVDIGDEMRSRPRAAIGRQGPRRHRRPEVGAADPYIHDIREGFIARAQNRARADVAREGEDPLARRLDLAPANRRLAR